MPEGSIAALHTQHKDLYRKYSQYNGKLFFLCSFVSAIFITGCSTNPYTDEYSIDFLTDQTSYISTDTITVVIINDSTDVFNIGLRCGEYLEMFFQKKKDGEWSENQWFWYMSLRCPTEIDSILPNESYSYELPAEWFDDVGTFRLIMRQWYSNGFTID